MRIHRLLLFALIAVPTWAAPEIFDSHSTSTVMVPMRDGVKLATDVYVPARNGKAVQGKFPALLVRTPYNKAGVRRDAEYLAQHGYAVAAQDCRGRFASEGEFYPFVNEGEDGYDAIEWAAAQPWSNGKVGTFGGSYLAWDQYHAAMYRPPHLVAMFAIVGGANFYDEFGYPGGTPNLGWPIWILNSARTSPQAADHPQAAEALARILQNPGQWLKLPPQERLRVFREFPIHARIYEDWRTHPEFATYWKQKGFFTAGYYQQMKDVPILFLTGWYDYFAEGVLDNFTALSRIQKTAKKLVVGPWPHATGAAECGNASFGESAGIEIRALIADWFDHWMKAEPFEMAGPETVRFFRMGGGDGSRTRAGRIEHGGEWRTAPSWPLPDLRPTKFYLQPKGELSAATAPGKGSSTYEFDPEHPVPTIGGRYGVGASTPHCAQDQVCGTNVPGCRDSEPLNHRPDVLSFATGPLEFPTEVTGKIAAKLWISSSAPDTDFTAKLIDVYPNGYALIVADGQIRMRYRNSFEKPELMKPGQVYEASIELGSVSNLFGAGHRIRVDVSSSNFPKFQPNPNTGGPIGTWTKAAVARNTVYFDAQHPSHIELPVVEQH